MYGFHFGPTAPSSLNGANNFEIALPKARTVTIQAALFTNTSYVVHWRVAYASGLTATALNTAEGFLTHGGSVALELNPSGQAYLYLFITDTAGTAATGGANDRLDKWVTTC
jgi:hypothetical protein